MSEQDKPEYFLSDEMFVQLMEREFQATGQELDPLVRQRLWQRLQKKKIRLGAVIAGILAAAALLVIMVRQPSQNPGSDLKSGQDTIAVQLHWEGSTLHISSPRAASMSLYADRQGGKPQRVAEPQSLMAKHTLALPLSQDQLQGATRVCAIVAANPGELQNLESQIEVIWPRMDDTFCLPLQ